MLKSFLLAFLASTLATSLPVSKVELGQIGARSLELAAITAIQAAVRASTDEEYAGGIYKSNDSYFYTLPVSQHHDYGVDYSIQVPANATLIGLYHTHPSGPGRSPDEFSMADITVAKRLKLIMFVGVIHTAIVMEYNPMTQYPVFNPFQQDTHYAGTTFPLR